MFDALKGLAGGGKAQKQYEELQALIDTAREERSALSTMLTQVTTRSAKLIETDQALERVDATAAAAAGSLDALARRIETLEQRATALAEVETRVQALIDTATTAQRQAEKLTAPDGELDKHRQQIQELSAQARDAQANIEALKQERAALEEFRHQLRASHAELKDVRQSVDQAVALRGELDQIRSVAGQLAHEYGKFRDDSREAREDAATATNAVRDVERKLGRLNQLQELSQATEEKLASVNALAEHVNQKARALDAQKHVIDRAVLEASRLNDMVWNMDAQISRLNEGVKQAARSEETLARIDQLVGETNARLDAATTMRDEFLRETARMEKDGHALVDVMRSSVERLALEKREFEAFDERLRALRDSIQDAEQRMEALGVRERQLAYLPQRIDEFSRSFESLMNEADELGRKQAGLDALQEQLAQVQDMAARATAQSEGLKQSRAELEALRREIQDFHQSYTGAAQLRDSLAADRAALEAFGERLSSFRARTPEIEAAMEAIAGRLAQLDEGMRQTTRLGGMAADLAAQLDRVNDRIQFVEMVEGRLNALHDVASEVDRKLAEQLARRAELETLRSQCDGVIAQMLDAQQKIEMVAALQGKILPMDIRISILQDRIDKTGERVKQVQRDETDVAAQEARLVELLDRAERWPPTWPNGRSRCRRSARSSHAPAP